MNVLQPHKRIRTNQGTMISVFLVMVFTAANLSAQPEQRAVIKSIIGQVEVSQEGTGKWRPARVNMSVKMGTDVRTFVESSADLEIAGGSMVKVGENTVITVAKLAQNPATGSSQTNLKVATGKMWANVKKLTNAKSEFDFETPTAVASIRGTRLGISVDYQGTAVDVFDGKVQVREKSSGKTITISTKNRAVVRAGGKGIDFIDFSKKTASDTAVVPVADPFAEHGAAGASDSATAKRDSVAGGTPDTAGKKIEPDSAITPAPKPKTPADSLPGRAGRDTVADMAEDVNKKYTEAVPATAKKITGVALSVASPKSGSVITEPMIQVSGTASPGAQVTANGLPATVSASGAFSCKVPIPNEAREYSVIIVARLADYEKSEDRQVTYAPKRTPLFLEIQNPQEGQTIRQNLLRITGKTAPGASITVNGRRASISGQGDIAFDMPFSERDIGDVQLEITAADDAKEISKIVNVIVDIASPQINTSVPSVVVREQGVLASRSGKLTICAFDRTAGDQLVARFQNNSRPPEEFTIMPGECQTVSCDEGKNAYSVKVLDKAKNVSNVITGTHYYLPGPLVIEIRNPVENPYVIADLPPMPRGVGTTPLRVEVEIEDGIRSVPESIKYCRLIGAGSTIQMNGNNNYRYYATIPITRGTHAMTVQVEDLSGNIMTKRLDIVVK